MTTQTTGFDEIQVASISGRPLQQMDSSEATVRRHDEFFFEVASLGPGDLLSRCREGPGNWWGEEECLRVDEQGHVVLMDSTVYFQHYDTQRSLIQIAASACFSVLSGRALGRACALTPALVEHLSKTWYRPRRPVRGILNSEDASSSEGGSSTIGPGALAVALGQHVATVPLQPWTDEASILAPLQCLPSAKEKGRSSGEDSTNLHGQLIAWSEDGRVVAVSLPTGDIVCVSNSPDRRGACLTSVPPYGGHRNGSPENLATGGGVAGLALRGSEERMEVLVLTFDATLVVYSFSPSGALGQKAILVCEKRLNRWHASTSAMSFHAYTDTVAIVGTSGASRSAAAVSLTIWRVRGGAISRTDASSRQRSSSSFPLGLRANASTGGVHARTATVRRTSSSAGAASAVGSRSEETLRERHGDQRLKWSGAEGGTSGAKRSEILRWSGSGNTTPSGGRVADKDESIPSFSALHFITLEGGSLVVPAPREGLGRGPPGALPALLPLVFPGLRAVSPPVQLEFNPSGDRLAVLDLGGGVTVVETSSVTARVSLPGRRYVASDGRSWRGGKGIRGPSVPSTKTEDAERVGSGAGVPRVVSVGWWSERTLAGVLSTGALAFMDTAAAAAARGLDLLGEESTTTAFPRMSAGGAVRWTESSSAPRLQPPVLGPRCTVWFAGDGRRAAVCWPGSGSGGGRWRGGSGERSRRGGGGAAIGLLSLASAEEIVDGRIGRGLLSEALALAVEYGHSSPNSPRRHRSAPRALKSRAVLILAECEQRFGAKQLTLGRFLSMTYASTSQGRRIAGTGSEFGGLRWVIHEVLSSIGLSNSQEASSALLEEGFRRCELLEGRRGRLRRDASNAPAPISSADVADGGSSGAVERASAPSTQAVDGWGDDDLDLDDTEDEQKGPPGEQGKVTQRGEMKERAEGVSQGASGMAGASGSSGGSGGGDGDETGRSTRMVRKCLIALQNLFETNSMAEKAQNRDFDVIRLREFLMVGSSTDPEVNSRTDATMWGKADFQQKLLQTAVMKYARAGEVSAVGVLFERHPVETLPIRLKVLSAHPETLDPVSYARLLPCRNPAPSAREIPSVTFESAGEEQHELPYAPPYPPLFFFMEGTPGNGQIETFGTRDHTGRRTEPLLTVEEMSLGGDHTRSDERGDDNAEEHSTVGDMLKAAEEQRSEGTLATWYLQRAKEIDSRGGQLRHALTLCELGAVRVGAGRSDGGFSSSAAIGELLQLRTLLRQLTSLVYAGSVNASMALSAWERMGLEEKLTEVLRSSSVETIASDVRAFTQTAHRSSSMRDQASSMESEGVLVRVLGNIVRASPSAETMEACAAVAKESRPEETREAVKRTFEVGKETETDKETGKGSRRLR